MEQIADYLSGFENTDDIHLGRNLCFREICYLLSKEFENPASIALCSEVEPDSISKLNRPIKLHSELSALLDNIVNDQGSDLLIFNSDFPVKLRASASADIKDESHFEVQLGADTQLCYVSILKEDIKWWIKLHRYYDWFSMQTVIRGEVVEGL